MVAVAGGSAEIDGLALVVANKTLAALCRLEVVEVDVPIVLVGVSTSVNNGSEVG